MLFATPAAAATAIVDPPLSSTATTATAMAVSAAPIFFTTLLSVPNINTIHALEQWFRVGLLR